MKKIINGLWFIAVCYYLAKILVILSKVSDLADSMINTK